MQKPKQRILLISLFALLVVGGALFSAVPHTYADSSEPISVATIEDFFYGIEDFFYGDDGYDTMDFYGGVLGGWAWDTITEAIGDEIEEAVAAGIDYLSDRAGIMLVAMFVGLFKLLVELIILPLVVPIVSMMLLLGLGMQNYLVNNAFTDNIWGLLLAVANGIYLLALFIASIAIISRINTGVYNLKKFLGGFITAVALSNLSLLMVRAMISLADLITNIFYQLYASLQVGTMTIVEARVSLIQFLVGLVRQVIDPLGDEFWDPSIRDFTSSLKAIAQVIILCVVLWLIIKLSLVLLERIGRLFISAITAPLVFALGLLPNFSKLTSQWWENTLKWLLVLPATMGVIVLSIWAFHSAGITSANDARHLSNHINPMVIADELRGGTPDDEVVTDALFVLVGLMGLWAAGHTNKALNLGSALAGHVETPMKAIQTGQGLARKGADLVTGKAGPVKLAKDTFTGKNALGKGLGVVGTGFARQAKAGSFGKRIQKSAIGGTFGEAWRQRQTRGPLGMIFNPKGRGAKMDADIKQKTNERALGLDTTEHQNITGKLDDVASDKHGGKSWSDLTQEEQKTLTDSNKSIDGLAKRQKDLSRTMAWRGREAFKEERM
ncbi:hypothetical protein KJ836_03755, partial [Patescibacteria group bacterium]|nr:hypothetical protein [Patescibacteria group bacterium]